MIGVVSGFSIIGVVIGLGYVLERTRLIGQGALHPLSRLIYFVASPALLFTVMASADMDVLFSPGVLVTVISIAVGIVAFVLVALLLFRRPVADTTIGVLAAVQANAGNIGMPVALYVLGDVRVVAPVMLVQVLVLTPVCLIIIDLSTQVRIDVRTILLQPFRNPAIVAALTGLAVALWGGQVPDLLMSPFEIVGGACVPLFLLTFGMALRGQPLIVAGPARHEVAAATTIKIVVMPVIAFVLGRYVFHLSDPELFPVVVVAALPTAQNVYNVAVRFGRSESMSISTIMVTTVLSVPVLLLAAALLRT